MKNSTVFVIGAGAMGSGIAQLCALSGHNVTLFDSFAKALEKGVSDIESSLRKMEEKWALPETAAGILSRIRVASGLGEASDSEIIIEAVFENLDVKRDILAKLEEICGKETIFGTNTSSLPITQIAAGLKHPERVVGIHFFNPVHRMKLVEIVKGLLTAEDVAGNARDFALSLGKEPVVVNKDTAGFIVNRINGMAFLEALKMYERGVASPDDIDKAMRLALGHPMGPFELMDLVGLDVVLNARMAIYDETREPAHHPPAVLKRMVQAGFLGRKTKKGFYTYS